MKQKRRLNQNWLCAFAASRQKERKKKIIISKQDAETNTREVVMKMKAEIMLQHQQQSHCRWDY